MRLTFTRKSGKYDELLVERTGSSPATIACPKQGIIPHDMVHYAVESTLAQGGFLKLVAAGQPAEFTTTGGEREEAVERLVEALQAELWGGRVTASELLDVYTAACAARGHAAFPVTPNDLDAIRNRLDQLTAQWQDVPVNGSLTLVL